MVCVCVGGVWCVVCGGVWVVTLRGLCCIEGGS